MEVLDQVWKEGLAHRSTKGARNAPPSSADAAGGSVVPRLINFSGVLKDNSGKPLTGSVTLTLSLYAEQEGGGPLWVETQTSG
jgi:hypothetical protein